MKVHILLALLILAVPVMADDASAKVTLDLKDVPLRSALDSLVKQTNVPIVAESGLKCMVNLTLRDISLEQAIATIADINEFRWKRLDLAVSKETVLAADEIEKAISALESLAIMGVALADKDNKTQTVFGKALPSAPLPKLPEGYKWQTIYLLQKPEERKSEEAADATDSFRRFHAINEERLELLEVVSSQDRELLAQDEFNRMLTVSPEVRRDIMRGWISAVSQMDPTSRREFGEEMRSNLGDLFRGMGHGNR